jgi:stearoyl-CoA desaturase (Delta-9 desaturase)
MMENKEFVQEKPKINWGPVIFLVTYQLLLLASLPFYLYYNTPGLGMILSGIVLLYLTGLSITGGYHRFYSHRSYKTNKYVEAVLLFLSSMAAQGSALRWSFDHRIHHAHVDTDEDPYSIKKGFWFAHCMWILHKPRPIEKKVVPDLMSNPLVMFQHRYYKLLMIGSNALVTLFFGWLFGDFLGAFVIVLWLRMFALHHFTWFINSLAHMWGEKPFCQELSAVDNYFLSMLTFGEGYHNYHHTFANDYRNGIRWFHFDPTKWMIWTLNKLGLAHGLKKMDPVTIEKRIVIETKVVLLEQIKKACTAKKEELEKTVHEMADQIVAKIAEFNKLKEEYLQQKQGEQCRAIIKKLRNEIRDLKRSLRQDWRQWMNLSKDIMRLEAAPA